MRPWADQIYAIPPEQVIGSSVRNVLQLWAGALVLVRQPEIDVIDDRAGKPVGIHKSIGRRALAGFGNSDGDLQMLQWPKRSAIALTTGRATSAASIRRSTRQKSGAGWGCR